MNCNDIQLWMKCTTVATSVTNIPRYLNSKTEISPNSHNDTAEIPSELNYLIKHNLLYFARFRYFLEYT